VVFNRKILIGTNALQGGTGFCPQTVPTDAYADMPPISRITFGLAIVAEQQINMGSEP
jgi:hypothetical protein